MLLTNGGTGIQARFLANTLLETSRQIGAFPRWLYANARFFGQRTSVPVGYQSVQRAIIPTINESGQVAAWFRPSVDMVSSVLAFGNIAGSFAVDIDATLAANVRSNVSATFQVDVDMVSSALAARGLMSARFDIVSRPTASDISQEVWNGFRVEGDLSAADAFRIVLAALAGKVSGAAGTTVTIRDTLDTKNRIVATVDADGNRSAVTLDGDL